MRFDRGTAGLLPWAATGDGPTVLVLAGLSTSTGVASDALVRSALAPLRAVRGRRQTVMNRWSGLPVGLTMAGLADEHARAIAALGTGPVDVVGVSTGASIALQLAADHPESVRRLVIVSGACRLSARGRAEQAQVAALLRSRRPRSAVRTVAATTAPRGTRTVLGVLAWAAAGRLVRGQAAADDLAETLEAEDQFDLAACARPVTAPTLVVMGARDRDYGPDLARETTRLIAGSHLLVVPRRGHLTAATHRRSVATIAGFLTAPAR